MLWGAVDASHTFGTDPESRKTDRFFAIDAETKLFPRKTAQSVFEADQTLFAFAKYSFVDLFLPHGFQSGQSSQGAVGFYGTGFALQEANLFFQLCDLTENNLLQLFLRFFAYHDWSVILSLNDARRYFSARCVIFAR